MKRIALACVLAVSLGNAGFAGNLAQPLADPEVIGPEDTMKPEEVANASSSRGNVLVPLLIFAAIAAVLSSSGGGSSGSTLPPPPVP